MPEDTRKYRPLRPGAQISLAASGGVRQDHGTIGCFVQPVIYYTSPSGDLAWTNIGPPCVLTCYHVIKPPANKPQPVDNYIHQPDAVGFENLIGEFYVGAWDGTIDAALCRLGDRALDKGPPSNEVLGGIGRIKTIRPVDDTPAPGVPLRKYGRSTSETFGWLGDPKSSSNSDGIPLLKLFNVYPNTSYPQEPAVFCDEGDSGAAIVDNNGALLGIIHSKYGTTQVGANVCRATEIFDRLTQLIQDGRPELSERQVPAAAAPPP